MQQIRTEGPEVSHIRRMLCLIATIFSQVIVSYPLLMLPSFVSLLPFRPHFARNVDLHPPHSEGVDARCSLNDAPHDLWVFRIILYQGFQRRQDIWLHGLLLAIRQSRRRKRLSEKLGAPSPKLYSGARSDDRQNPPHDVRVVGHIAEYQLSRIAELTYLFGDCEVGAHDGDGSLRRGARL